MNKIYVDKNILLISSLQSFSQSYMRIFKYRTNLNEDTISSLEINLQYKCLNIWNEIKEIVCIHTENKITESEYKREVEHKLQRMHINKEELFEDIIYLYGMNSIDILSHFIYNFVI